MLCGFCLTAALISADLYPMRSDKYAAVAERPSGGQDVVQRLRRQAATPLQPRTSAASAGERASRAGSCSTRHPYAQCRGSLCIWWLTFGLRCGRPQRSAARRHPAEPQRLAGRCGDGDLPSRSPIAQHRRAVAADTLSGAQEPPVGIVGRRLQQQEQLSQPQQEQEHQQT